MPCGPRKHVRCVHAGEARDTGFSAGSTAAWEDRNRQGEADRLGSLLSHFDKGVQLFGGTNTARPAKRKLAAAIATLLSVGIVATGCTSAPAPTAGKNDSRATVVRIVDGDTIVAEVSGTETTIRLLNIDTPETKDPNEPVQCLGPEATEYMKSLLAPGDMIDLEYDVQRLDPYGRTLAGVYKDDSLVNADIAAAGLGVAVLYQPNERFYAEVKAAEQDAQNAEQGLFSPSIDCTVPAMVNQATSDLEGLEEVDPESSAAAGTALAVVAAAVLAGKAKKAALAALDTGEDGVAGAVWAARKAKHLPRLDAALNRATAMESKLCHDPDGNAGIRKESESCQEGQGRGQS